MWDPGEAPALLSTNRLTLGTPVLRAQGPAEYSQRKKCEKLHSGDMHPSIESHTPGCPQLDLGGETCTGTPLGNNVHDPGQTARFYQELETRPISKPRILRSWIASIYEV